MGRPSKAQAWLTDERLSLLRSYKRAGLTDEQVAEKIGIKPPTLIDWKKRFPQVSEALKSGFEDLVANAEDALYSKFTVQTVTEEIEEAWVNADGEVKKHKTVKKKQVLPDTTAIIFFLKSKANWKDGNEIKAVIDGISFERKKEIEALFDEPITKAETTEQSGN